MVSVVRTVVGARREALDRFLGFRARWGWTRSVFGGSKGTVGDEEEEVKRAAPEEEGRGREL